MRRLIRRIRQSLSVKLSIGILLMAFPISVLSLGILFMQSRHIVKQEAAERVTSVLNTTSQRVNRFLLTIETATNNIDWLVTANLRPEALLEYSNRIVRLNANVSGCSITTESDIFSEQGRYFSAYSVRQGDSVITVREGKYDYFEKEWYKRPSNLGKACWIDPFDDYNEGTLSASGKIASYSKPLYTEDGRFVGVISTDLSLNSLSEVIQAEKPYPNAYFLMLGEDGQIFVHPDSARLVDRTIFSGMDTRHNVEVIALGHEMTTGKSGFMRVTVGDQPCLVCYQPVAGTNWSLAIVCPDSDILRNYYKLTYIICPLLVIGLLLILFFCRRIVKHALSPLNQLENQMQIIAEGKYDEKIPHIKRRDVVGLLQNSFATMQESLERHVGNIRQMNEQAVQRNEELAKANKLAEEAGRQKTAFIQNMTHQIRTPLNVIMGFAQVLRDSIKTMSNEDSKRITSVMQHNSMTLTRMVLMLYDSSDSGLSEELEDINRENVSCNEVARESIEYTNLYYPNLKIGFQTSVPDSFCIFTSRLYLMRSLREILYNSAKYSDGKNILLSVAETADTIRFVFQDTGPGIDEYYHEQIYVPFSKINELSEGLGLGLPLAKRHCVNLGGDLYLDTSYHEGCRFVIEFPKQ